MILYGNIDTYKYVSFDNCLTTFISVCVDFRDTELYLTINFSTGLYLKMHNKLIINIADIL